MPRRGTGLQRFLLISISFLIGFFVRDLSLNRDVPTRGSQETPSRANLSHCHSLIKDVEFKVPKNQASKPPASTIGGQPVQVHTYRPDGLLQLNPNAPHPILELIRTAEKEWQKKLDGASRTLGDAVREYKRRYKRAPPLGFDDW